MLIEPSRVTDWPASGLEPVAACPLCGSSERQLAYSDLQDYFFRSGPGHWRFYSCLGCGSGYLDPRPSPETIGIAYRHYYTHRSNEISYSGVRKLWHLLRDDYLQSRFGFQSGRTLWPGRWVLPLFPFFCRGLDTAVARNLEWVTPGNNRLLDVGCGNGEFMEFARQAGWLVQGVDIDVAAVTVATAKGLDVIAGGIEQFVGKSACFDRITLSHVVEHVFDPIDLLRDCFRLLKPGGVLWIDTPNMGSTGLKVFGEYWRGLEPPRHLMLFSRASLVDSLIKIGFGEVEDRFSTLATTAVWRESRVIMARARVRRNWRQALPGRFLAKVDAFFVPAKREFITLTCRKPG